MDPPGATWPLSPELRRRSPSGNETRLVMGKVRKNSDVKVSSVAKLIYTACHLATHLLY